jgi:hypothetical protein
MTFRRGLVSQLNTCARLLQRILDNSNIIRMRFNLMKVYYIGIRGRRWQGGTEVHTNSPDSTSTGTRWRLTVGASFTE